MYQVTVKGRTIEELKQAVEDVHAELNGQSVTTEFRPHLHISKSLVEEETNTEEMEEVSSPYAPVRIGEEDDEGVPWNSKIHASSKSKNKDGTWRVKRGVEDSEVEAYKAQFKITPVAAPVITPPVQTPVVTAPVAPTLPPTMPTMQKGHTFESFKAGFPVILSALLTEGKIDQNYVNSLKEFFSVTEIWNINDEQKLAVFNQWTSPEWNLIQKVG